MTTAGSSARTSTADDWLHEMAEAYAARQPGADPARAAAARRLGLHPDDALPLPAGDWAWLQREERTR